MWRHCFWFCVKKAPILLFSSFILLSYQIFLILPHVRKDGVHGVAARLWLIAQTWTRNTIVAIFRIKTKHHPLLLPSNIFDKLSKLLSIFIIFKPPDQFSGQNFLLFFLMCFISNRTIDFQDKWNDYIKHYQCAYYPESWKIDARPHWTTYDTVHLCCHVPVVDY